LAASAAAVAACSAVAWVHPPGQLSAAEIEAANAVVAARHSAGEAAAQGDPLSPLEQDIQDALLATEWPADLDPGLDELDDYLGRQWSSGCLDVTAENVQEGLPVRRPHQHADGGTARGFHRRRVASRRPVSSRKAGRSSR